jgi:hypothetical protein
MIQKKSFNTLFCLCKYKIIISFKFYLFFINYKMLKPLWFNFRFFDVKSWAVTTRGQKKFNCLKISSFSCNLNCVSFVKKEDFDANYYYGQIVRRNFFYYCDGVMEDRIEDGDAIQITGERGNFEAIKFFLSTRRLFILHYNRYLLAKS